jgi:SpoVK/Ycf46/Vps4 family AAA+-type ATPase
MTNRRHVYESDTTAQTPEESYVFRDGLHKVSEIDHRDIPAGFYRFEMNDQYNLQLVNVSMPDQDRYIEAGSSRLDIQEDMNRFFRNEDLYDEMDLAHRRGALLYGPPGTGKTYSIVRAARKAMEELNVLVFLLHQDVSFDQLSKLRPYFQERRTVFLFEEVSRSAMKGGNRAPADLLSFLDGELSWDHNYNIATTNYPGDLPGNLVDRPGRFDVLIEMDHPGASERKRFLDAYLGEGEYPSGVVDRLKGFSLSYIKEMVLRSRLYDRSLVEIIDQFDHQKEQIKAAFDTASRDLGFGPSGNGHL